jgi:SAM-dependent methyltransferase
VTERGDWVGYYDEQGAREPRDVLLRVLELFDQEDRRGLAVDVGCGQGWDTQELLRRGWGVVAIDGHQEGIRRLRRRIPDEHADRLETIVSAMEEVELPPADLVYASYSLPFCRRSLFPRLWDDIRAAIRPDGRFAGQLFGDRDTWAATEPEMNFFTIDDARALFDGMAIESFVEEELEDEGWDEMKHWHVFHAIARR